MTSSTRTKRNFRYYQILERYSERNQKGKC
nr:MAG TPA: hypothetical protein [Bacteriophage sp.]